VANNTSLESDSDVTQGSSELNQDELLEKAVDGSDEADNATEAAYSSKQKKEPQETDMKLRLKLIRAICAARDDETRKQRKKEAIKQLGLSERSIQREINRYLEKGSEAFASSSRSDTGSFRIDKKYPIPEKFRLEEKYQDFKWSSYIIETYINRNKGSQRMNQYQVFVRVQKLARLEFGLQDGQYPSKMAVYRVLEPLINQENKTVRHAGQSPHQHHVKTRCGQSIPVRWSQDVWQVDSTRADVLLVDKDGVEIGCPVLTIILDTYSGCVVGFHLGFLGPGSKEVALALRHAILPKNYGPEYNLENEWGIQGKPYVLFTDGGSEHDCEHISQVSEKLGFVHYLRLRPSDGGGIERIFKTLNTEFFSPLPGYKGSNVKDRPKDAEKDACLTLADLEMLLVKYLVDNYNQRQHPKVKTQTRYQRWQATQDILEFVDERQLDICLMKEAHRKVQKYGDVYFKNLIYRGDCLSSYAGEYVTLRYDPRDITTMFAYSYESEDKLGEFIAHIHPRDLECERLSLDELEVINAGLREEAKDVTNQTVLSVLREIDYRDSRVAEIQRLNRKQRRRSEHQDFHEIPADSVLREEELPTSEEALTSVNDSRTGGSSTSEDSLASDVDSSEEVEGSELNTGTADSAEEKEAEVPQVEIETPEVEVFDWDELMQNF
jgi:putative transposase